MAVVFLVHTVDGAYLCRLLAWSMNAYTPMYPLTATVDLTAVPDRASWVLGLQYIAAAVCAIVVAFKFLSWFQQGQFGDRSGPVPQYARLPIPKSEKHSLLQMTALEYSDLPL